MVIDDQNASTTDMNYLAVWLRFGYVKIFENPKFVV